jgi:hypothetical protein
MLGSMRLPNFSGRKVCVIGPSSGVVEDLDGVELSSFDLVVRMNRACEIPIVVNDKEIWEHDVYVRNQTGNRPGAVAGHYTESGFQRAGVKIVLLLCYRWRDVTRLLRHLVQIRSFGSRPQVGVFLPMMISEYARMIDGAKPTTGFVTLAWLLRQPLSALHIAGFSFAQTSYMPGYNDNLATDEQALVRLEADMNDPKRHKPLTEKRVIRRLISEAQERSCKVTVGPTVADALTKNDPTSSSTNR